LKKEGIVPSIVAEEESQEGVIARLRLMDWEDDDYVLMPRSSLARSALENFFSTRGIRHQVCDLYDTRPRDLNSFPPLEGVEEIVFTSPSTVHAFRKLCPSPPQVRLTPIGPVTAEALRIYIQNVR
jgi:uroporphyrinogen-III synthase